MKAQIAWLVIDKDYPHRIELYRDEPEDYILEDGYQYLVQKIVYFEVEE